MKRLYAAKANTHILYFYYFSWLAFMQMPTEWGGLTPFPWQVADVDLSHAFTVTVGDSSCVGAANRAPASKPSGAPARPAGGGSSSLWPSGVLPSEPHAPPADEL